MSRVLDDDACIVAKERHHDLAGSDRGLGAWEDDLNRPIGFTIYDKRPGDRRRAIYEGLVAVLESRGCKVVEGEYPHDGPDEAHTMAFVVLSKTPLDVAADELAARVHMQNVFAAEVAQ